MLKLTRKENESIIISLDESVDRSLSVGELFDKGDIEMVIKDISKGQVIVGLDAPMEFKILRVELTE